MYGQMGERNVRCTTNDVPTQDNRSRVGAVYDVTVYQVLPRVEGELLNVRGEHPRETRERHERQKHHLWTLCARVCRSDQRGNGD